MKKAFMLVMLAFSILILFGTCKKEDGMKGDSSTFTDSRDGQTYNWIEIGTQVWMAENLRFLPKVVGPQTGSEKQPYFYVYGYDGTDTITAKQQENFHVYGVLYNWPAAKHACPPGWHLPSDREWSQLTKYLRAIPATKLKASSGWLEFGSGTDQYGFSALPGGLRHADGGFGSLGTFGFWWSASEFSAWRSWYRSMQSENDKVNSSNYFKYLGLSVRCVRDN